MKLTTRALWLPAAILLAIFVIMGSIFFWMISDHTEENISHELTQMLSIEREKLTVGLSLITATQTPSDAIIGLDDDDSSLAMELVKQVSRMGLDAIYISDLEGRQLFSSKGTMSADLSKAVKHADRALGAISYLTINSSMVAFAPIYDVDTPVGFLFFVIKLNDSLFAYANKLHFEAGVGKGALASERLTQAEIELKQNSEDFLTMILFTIIITLAVGLGIIMAVMGSTSKNIIGRIQELLHLLSKMAKGDFTERANPQGSDELAQLQKAANATSEQLRSMIMDLSSATEELSSSVLQISNVIKASSEGVVSQKVETEQVATAMNQMAATIQEIAQTTGTAAKMADKANKEADNGNRVVSTTIASIRELTGEIEKASEVIDDLRKNSDDIGSVLDVIKDIAEQTNLLALNAAIEAARAGEQGRGFAVVADEVRTLAGRTQQSTEEIESMIEHLQSGAQNAVQVMQRSRVRSKDTVDQASRAGESLQIITSSATEISSMNTQIASAAEEQGMVAEKVNQKVVKISHIADQASENAEEMVSTNQRLNSLAETLRVMTSKFIL